MKTNAENKEKSDDYCYDGHDENWLMSSVSTLSKNLQKFRLVTFDVTGTLLKFRMPPPVQYAKAASSFGYKINQDKLNETFRNEFKALEKKYPNFGKNDPNMQWQNWWRLLVMNTFEKAEADIPKEKLELITNALITTYKSAESWTQIDGASELVTKIKNASKIVGVISNFDPSLKDLVVTMKLPKFDFLITSYDVGLSKPSKEIYDAACNSYGLQPSESLHIGNKYDKDYFGAINAGWSSLLINKELCKEKLLELNINTNHVYRSLTHLTHTLETKEIVF